ncbi:Transmembrane protein [Trichinella spiralis]|uniref:Transmembrane protein n=1 Tax=Trichinella spiralis TaxID=6334 RepID=A0A0V1BL76_TRISP|nr:Transmembrane protein [Trichinella spiralis]
MEMGDKIPIVRDEQPNTSDAIIEADQSFYYEEFMEGSVPCPSCDGAGRIPKEQEKQLVALIPLTDKRLKPRRTTLWVLSAVSASLLTWALCIFFLIPRSIVVSSDDSSIVPYAAYVNESQPTVKLSFLKYLNVTNFNFVTISVVNASMVSIYILDSRRVVGQTTNLTHVIVPLRSTRTIVFNTTITFDSELLVKYCTFIKIIFMQFDVTITSNYLGHSEQTSVSNNQQLYCSNQIPDDIYAK